MKLSEIIIITFQRRKSLCNIEKKNMQDEEDAFTFRGKDEVAIGVNIQIRQTLHLHLFCSIYKSVRKLLLSYLNKKNYSWTKKLCSVDQRYKYKWNQRNKKATQVKGETDKEKRVCVRNANVSFGYFKSANKSYCIFVWQVRL